MLAGNWPCATEADLKQRFLLSVLLPSQGYELIAAARRVRQQALP